MQGKLLYSALLKIALFVSLLGLAPFCAGQYSPASPPIADPKDARFDAVSEDWTSPSLDKSHLVPITPMSTGVALKPGYSFEMVRLQWRFGDPIDIYVMKPRGVPKPPVVLYLPGYTVDNELFRSEKFQQGATRDGFAMVAFTSALSANRFHDRGLTKWFVSELPESLAESAHDVQMLLDYLAKRGDLDMDRVGMMAQDSGASIAILAAAVDPRIKVLDIVDPWGDWPEWLTNSPQIPDDERQRYLTADFLNKVSGLDPLTWLPKVHAKIRFQDAVFVPITPMDAKDELRDAAPKGTKIVVYQKPEDTRDLLEGNHALQWIHDSLAALPQPDAPGSKNASTASPKASPHSQ
jgi:hypothetical protein